MCCCLFQPGLRAVHVLFVYFSLVYELYTWSQEAVTSSLTRELLQRHANVNFCTSVRFVYKKIKGFVHNKLKGGNMALALRYTGWIPLVVSTRL